MIGGSWKTCVGRAFHKRNAAADKLDFDALEETDILLSLFAETRTT